MTKGIFRYISIAVAAAITVSLLMSCSGQGDDGTGDGDGNGDKVEPIDTDYQRKLLLMQFTSVGCVNCPMMSAAVRQVQEERPETVVPVALHIPYGNVMSDPMVIKMNLTYAEKFGVTGLPAGYMDMRMDMPFTSEKATIDAAADALLDADTKPAGIAIESSFDENTREAEVKVHVTAVETGKYRLLVFLTENGIDAPQMGTEDAGYRHDNVVRDVLATNIFGVTLNGGREMPSGLETETVRAKVLDGQCNAGNMRVVAAVLKCQDDGRTYACSNVADCQLGESADYKVL